MPTSNNPKRQKGGEENSTPSTTASATRAEENEDIITTTTQRINRTFDEAKENTRRAVQEAERASTIYADCHNQPRAISGGGEGYYRELS
jgi:hypothetical protein